MLYFTSTVQRVHVLSLVLFCKETCSYARTYSYTDVSILSSSVITKYYTVLYVLIVYGVYSYYQLSCSTGTSGKLALLETNAHRPTRGQLVCHCFDISSGFGASFDKGAGGSSSCSSGLTTCYAFAISHVRLIAHSCGKSISC